MHCEWLTLTIINNGCLSPHNNYSDNLAKQLCQASDGGRDQEVLELLQRGAPPNSDYYTREHDGDIPLHRACANNHLRSAKLLIKFGAIVAARDYVGWTPLHYAYAHNRKDTAKLLLEHNCPTGEPGCYSLAKCLLQQNFKVDAFEKAIRLMVATA